MCCSLDDSVIARLELSGGTFEIILDPAIMDVVGLVRGSDLLSYLVVDTIFEDAGKGVKPAGRKIVDAFGTIDVAEIADRIVSKGEIQLTAGQRREILRARRSQIVADVAAAVVDSQTGLPHPPSRIELALKESKFRVDLFRPLREQVKRAIRSIGSLIPIEVREASGVSVGVKDHTGCYGDCIKLRRKKKRERSSPV